MRPAPSTGPSSDPVALATPRNKIWFRVFENEILIHFDTCIVRYLLFIIQPTNAQIILNIISVWITGSYMFRHSICHLQGVYFNRTGQAQLQHQHTDCIYMATKQIFILSRCTILMFLKTLLILTVNVIIQCVYK